MEYTFELFIILRTIERLDTVDIKGLHKCVQKTIPLSEQTIRRRIGTLRKEGYINVLGQSPAVVEMNPNKEREARMYLREAETKFKV